MTSPGRTSAVEPAAFDLLEEAVHLLRRAPAGTHAIHLAGSGPLVAGFLYFWAALTWFRPDSAWLAWGALLLAGLFVWMKTCHALYAQRLLAQRMDEMPPAWSWRRAWQAVRGQVCLQPAGLYLLPLAAVTGFPFAWAFAYLQSAAVLGAVDDVPPGQLRTRAWAQALLWPRQNHVALGILSLLWLFVFVNVASGLLFVPWLATRLLGLRTAFSFSGWTLFNTTFLMTAIALTWLACDPLCKAFYVLRVFYGRARRDGEDLLVDLAAARKRRRLETGGPGLAALVLVVATLAVAAPAGLCAAAPPTAPSTASRSVEPQALDRSIQEVLARREYQWRLPPRSRPETKTQGFTSRVFHLLFDTVAEIFRTVLHWLARLSRWMNELLPHSKSREPGSGGANWTGILRVLVYGLAVSVIGLLTAAIWIGWRERLRARPRVVQATPVGEARPDLGDESVQASELPEAGWLALAREQVGAGQWRLALRALYLALLARLAAEGRLTLARHKTNLEYERELHRRAWQQPEVTARFGRRRRQFEDSWYGAVVPDVPSVRSWLTELEGGPR